MSHLTDAEVAAAFAEFRNDRTFANVRLAKTITSVTVENRVLTAIYDPEAAGMHPDTFWNSLFPWDNAADFIGTPIMFNNPGSNELRQHIDRIETFDVEGTERGSRTVAELYEIGTGEPLPEN